MTLRRTALARKSELKRPTPLPRRKRELKARVVKTSTRRRRETGPTAATRTVVLDRAGGACEICGDQLHDGYEWISAHSFHHRQPRGAGGTTRDGVNAASNLLLLCGSGVVAEGSRSCHGQVESHRALAYSMGWLVRQPADPALTPVVVAGAGSTTSPWVLLNDTGEYVAVVAGGKGSE